MKPVLKSLGLVLILIAYFLTPCNAYAGEEEAYTPECNLDGLSWILGTWQMDGRSNIIVETWTQASEQTFEGKSYTISLVNNDTTFAESLRIVEMGGEIYYIADVSHNPFPILFKLVESEAGRIALENKEHGFPQSIIYHLESESDLKVTVEGMDKSSNQEKILEFHYKKKQ